MDKTSRHGRPSVNPYNLFVLKGKLYNGNLSYSDGAGHRDSIPVVADEGFSLARLERETGDVVLTGRFVASTIDNRPRLLATYGQTYIEYAGSRERRMAEKRGKRQGGAS